MTIAVTVLLFGPQAALAGARQLRLDAPEGTVAGVRAALAAACPALGASLPASRIAVNREFAADGDAVRSFDEIALIGMVSGG